jgi:hypothetical protein
LNILNLFVDLCLLADLGSGGCGLFFLVLEFALSLGLLLLTMMSMTFQMMLLYALGSFYAYESAYDSVYDFLHKVASNLDFNQFFLISVDMQL